MAIYPASTFYFRVTWGGNELSFTEVSGLKMEIAEAKYRDGMSLSLKVIKLPGMRKYGDITFKKGLFKDDKEFYEWFKKHHIN